MKTALTYALSSILMFVLSIASSTASADDDAAKARLDKMREAYRKQTETTVEGERAARQALLTMTIDQMHRVANLSDAQVARLQIAAKGAVDHSLQDLREQLEHYYEARIKAASGGVPAATTVRMTAKHGANVAAEEEIWINTVAKVLSAEQQERYETALQQQAAFKRQFIVQSVIASIDSKVLLSEQQRQQLAKVIDASLDDTTQNAVGTQMLTVMQRYSAQLLTRIDKEQLRAVLSEEQVKGMNMNRGAARAIRPGQGFIQRVVPK